MDGEGIFHEQCNGLASPLKLYPQVLALTAIVTLFASCNAPPLLVPTIPPTATLTPAPTPTVTNTPIPPTPTISPEWVEAGPGIEVRAMSMPLPDSDPAEVILTRITPALVTIRVEYNPDSPLRASEWQSTLGATVVINGGFFQEDHSTAGLLIREGEAHGVSFDQIDAPGYEHGGMISVTGGLPSIRLLSASPYLRGEDIDFALQGLPMLIDQGAPVAFDLPEHPARRTAVALDSSGRLILITVSAQSVTLIHFRDWLASTPELAINEALGLDGGPSTGLAIRAGTINVMRDSFTPVPSVLAIFTK